MTSGRLGVPVAAPPPSIPPLLPGTDDGIARRVGLSAGSQVGAQVVHLVLNIASSLLIIRYLSPSVYGDFVLIMTLVTIVGMLSDFGINKLGIRQISAGEGTESEVIGTILVLRLSLTVVCIALVQAVLLGLSRSPEVRLAGALASLTFAGTALLSVAIAFSVRLKQHVEVFTILFGELVETALVVWLVLHGGTLPQLFAATAFGTGAAAGVAFVLARRRLGLRIRFVPHRVAPLLLAAWPLAAAGMVGIVLVRMDSFLLAVLRSSADVGIYGAAYAPIEYLVVAAVALGTVFLPLLSRYWATDRPRFLSVYQRGTEVLLIFVLPLCLCIAVFARPAVLLAYSNEYVDAVEPFRLLGVYVVVMSVCAWQAVVLLSVGAQRLTVRYNTVMLVVSVPVHVVLISWQGPLGAALGSVLVGTVTATWAARLIRRVADVRPSWARVRRVVAANAVCGGTGLGGQLLGAPWWLAAVLAVAVYAPALFLVGAVPRRLGDLLTPMPNVAEGPAR